MLAPFGPPTIKSLATALNANDMFVICRLKHRQVMILDSHANRAQKLILSYLTMCRQGRCQTFDRGGGQRYAIGNFLILRKI